MTDLKFEKKLVPSQRFESGTWLITRCMENNQVSDIDLGWTEADVGIEYRHIGIFKHEEDALFVIQALETLANVHDVKTTLLDTGFTKYKVTGFSHGQSTYILQINEGSLSAFLEFDPHGNGTRLRLVLPDNVYRAIEIGTLQLDTSETRLSTLGRSSEVVTTILCTLLKARIASGDATKPILPVSEEPITNT